MKLKSMKLKSIMITLALSTISLNAMALEGKGVKLLSEKIESSPGMKAGFIQQAPTMQSKSYHVVMVHSQAHDAQGRVRTNVRLLGNHSFYINNYTNQIQTYTYKYELNCDGRYIRKIDHVSVAPGGYARDSADSFLYTDHSTTGSWAINAVTDVNGESSGNHVATGNLRVTN
jgi:hypothetical protein